MAETEFQYKLSNIDMRDFYLNMICCHMDCSEVVLVEEIEDESKILRKNGKTKNFMTSKRLKPMICQVMTI